MSTVIMTAIEIVQDTTFTIDQTFRIGNTQMKNYHCLFGGKQREGKTTIESDPCRKKLKPNKREDQCPFYSAFNNIVQNMNFLPFCMLLSVFFSKKSKINTAFLT